ncbi:MAG: asparagine--tRNA ligase [Treponema sp.]|jgi:asparaginyl-tRNA synthetase|nr:asparagine--tRNA ligase [Treponema sp.]
MFTPLIKELFSLPADSREVTVRGWVRTKRELKNLIFLEVNDGSCMRSLQCAFDRASADRGVLERLSTGASAEIRGNLVPSPASGQAVELAAQDVRIIGEAPAEAGPGIPAYPLQKKRHSLEFLREIAHLRARTNTFGAVARIRNRLAFGVHEFFQARGFCHIHTPVITANDAEGAGALFQVTALDLQALARTGNGPDYTRDFFGKPAYLTVSGQLEAETYAAALSRVYTFGPVFRAEHSNTARHLAEFWMVEPECAFACLEDNIALAEDFLKALCRMVLRDCAEDLGFFGAHNEKGLAGALQSVVDSAFTPITYTEAIGELEKNAPRAGFAFKPSWGCDLQSEHEKFLTEQLVRGPVVVTDYPKELKAFYMKQNGDGKTVRAMDVLLPRLGEIIGGSEREDDLDKLEQRMEALGMPRPDYAWYTDLRRYGSVPHAGFGLGFDRLVQYVTGMGNIRDVIPYPRALGQADF